MRIAKRRILTLVVALATALGAASQGRPQVIPRGANIAFGANRRMADSSLVGYFDLGLFSKVETLRGVQLSMVGNVAADRMWGFQLSPVTNIAMSIPRGTQLSAVANVCASDMRGTVYKYHANVHPRTFEARLGLTWHLW